MLGLRIQEVKMKWWFKGICTVIFCIAQYSYASTLVAPQIAVGGWSTSSDISSTRPLILTRDQNSWSNVNKINNLPANLGETSLYSVSCSANICNGVGVYTHNAVTLPLFLTSNDQGQSWTFVDKVSQTPSSMDKISLYTLRCSANTCIAVGMAEKNNHFSPVLAKSDDSGKSWKFSNAGFADLSNKEGQLSYVEHSGNVWIVGGYYDYYYFPYVRYYQTPLLLVSKDNGNTWSQLEENSGLPSTDMLKGALLTALQCTDNSCFAATTGSQTAPFLMQSQDHGQSWSVVSAIANIPSASNLNPFLSALSCTNTFCVSAGSWDWMSPDQPPKGLPFILRSDNKGFAWSFVENIMNLPTNFQGVELNSASCSENMCVVGGNFGYEKNSSKLPLLLSSQDSGLTWSFVQTIKNLPSSFLDASIKKVNCSADICIAIGSWNKTAFQSLPLILESQDKGQTWTFIENITNLPSEMNSGSIADFMKKDS